MNNLKSYTLYIVNAVDIISCVLAYFLAYYIRFTFMDERYGGSPSQGYLYFLFVVLVSYFVVNFTILFAFWYLLLKIKGLSKIINNIKKNKL